MNPLASIYDSLATDYEQLVDEVNQIPVQTGFTALDFFSPEPYFQELNNLADDKLKIYASDDELPEDSEFHLLAIADGKAKLARNYYGEDVYYDSFFVYPENEKRRYQVYFNNGEVKPIKVEQLIRNEDGSPAIYRQYSQYGYHEFFYSWAGRKHLVERNYYDLKQNLVFKDRLEVSFNEDMSAVDKIIQITDKETTALYDRDTQQSDVNELLQQAKDVIVNTLLEDLKKSQNITEEVLCLLFEYTMQGPFPPTVGLGLNSEKEDNDADENNYGPLAFYNAPDMQYFSEADTLDIDFYRNGNALFLALNSRLDDMDFEQASELVMQAYVDICNKLKRSRTLKTLFPVHKDFHITARDFEDCNELEFLQQTLNQKQLRKLQSAIAEHEANAGLSAEDQAVLDSLQVTHELKANDYDRLKASLADIETEDLFSKECLFFLEPFKFEKTHKRLSHYHCFCDTPGLTSQPDGENYYHYRLQEDRIVYIAQYVDGNILREYFYVYDDAGISEYYFHVGGKERSLEMFSRLEMSLKKPRQYVCQHDDHLTEIVYEINESDHVIAGHEHELMFVSDMKMERRFRHGYYYDDHHKLSRVTHQYIPGADEPPTVFGESVDFCSDLSYLEETLAEVVKAQTNDILPHMNKAILTDSLALVLEYNNQLPFPLMNIFVLYAHGQDIQWQEVNVYNRDEPHTHSYMNFCVYTSSEYAATEKNHLSAEDAAGYIHKAFALLATSLNERIAKEYTLEVPVLTKPQMASIADINARLKAVLKSH